jgi:hypothetical protein
VTSIFYLFLFSAFFLIVLFGDRSIKVFFDVEKLMAEDFIQEIERVLPGIEDRMHAEEKKEERCQSSVEVNKGLNGKNAFVYRLSVLVTNVSRLFP